MVTEVTAGHELCQGNRHKRSFRVRVDDVSDCNQTLPALCTPMQREPKNLLSVSDFSWRNWWRRPQGRQSNLALSQRTLKLSRRRIIRTKRTVVPLTFASHEESQRSFHIPIYPTSQRQASGMNLCKNNPIIIQEERPREEAGSCEEKEQSLHYKETDHVNGTKSRAFSHGSSLLLPQQEAGSSEKSFHDVSFCKDKAFLSLKSTAYIGNWKNADRWESLWTQTAIWFVKSPDTCLLRHPVKRFGAPPQQAIALFQTRRTRRINFHQCLNDRNKLPAIGGCS